MKDLKMISNDFYPECLYFKSGRNKYKLTVLMSGDFYVEECDGSVLVSSNKAQIIENHLRKI